MRSFLIAVAVCIVLVTSFPGMADAVGLYTVGKEECNCSPLVARGIQPDVLNKLGEAFAFPQIAMALDRLALAVRGSLSQFEAPETEAVAEPATTEEETPAVKEKEKEKEGKPAAVKKKPMVKAKAATKKKVHKKKRVPQPTRTM
jgi:hypothetical protein